MAEKKKRESIYKKPLKDINKDGKKNLADTWLGDALGLDGKLGVQGPGIKKSLKGARRGKDEVPKESKRPKSRPRRSTTKDEPLERGPSTRPRRSPTKTDMDTSVRKAMEEQRKTAQPKTSRKAKEYTYAEWKKMTRAERKAAGLPVSDIGGQLEFNRFMAGITGKDYTSTGSKAPSAPKPSTGSSSRRSSRPGRSAGEVGMAKGGMAMKKEGRYQQNGGRDMKKTGMFYKSSSPKGYK